MLPNTLPKSEGAVRPGLAGSQSATVFKVVCDANRFNGRRRSTVSRKVGPSSRAHLHRKTNAILFHRCIRIGAEVQSVPQLLSNAGPPHPLIATWEETVSAVCATPLLHPEPIQQASNAEVATWEETVSTVCAAPLLHPKPTQQLRRCILACRGIPGEVEHSLASPPITSAIWSKQILLNGRRAQCIPSRNAPPCKPIQKVSPIPITSAIGHKRILTRDKVT